MKKITNDTERTKCPVCGAEDGQMRNGANRSGTQTYRCRHCNKFYTPNPKQREYSEETKEVSIKMYYSGVSGRGVGKILRMSKANVYNWIKKNEMNVENFSGCAELDELYWFIERKPRTETRENVYIITMVSREPRQIVGFDVALDKSPARLQNVVDSAPPAETYYTDGYLGYVDVVYPGKHIRNVRDKSNTYTVEGVNADLRHYVPILRGRSRCFARKQETLQVVMDVFVDAYNRFGAAKHKYRQTYQSGEIPFGLVDFLC